MRLDRPVLKDNLIGALFGAANLFGRKTFCIAFCIAFCINVDGAAFLAHVKRNRRQLEQLHESR